MTDDEIVTALAEALRDIVDDARELGHAEALLPTIRRVAEQRAAEELLAAADSYEDEAEQPAINRLADEVYRPGDCLSSLWLRARAAALTAADHGRNAT